MLLNYVEVKVQCYGYHENYNKKRIALINEEQTDLCVSIRW
jgi:hypothetical protein